MPMRQLRGFRRVHLKKGESQHLSFKLEASKDFTYYDAAAKAYAVAAGDYEIEAGASSGDLRLRTKVKVH